MLKVDLVNVQAISEAHMVFEDNSISEFTGNNSNGKSILSKVIEYLTKGDLIHKDVREALIKDTAESAVVLFTLNNKQLGIVLAHELKNSIVMYVPNLEHENDEGGKILRPLSDSNGVDAMVKEFGFRTYSKGDICLQLAPTFGAVPFVTTSGSVNNDIVTDITIDKVADEFLKSFSTITFPTFKDRVKRLTKEKEHLETVLENMESYDWRAYEAIAEKMSDIYNAIRAYQPIKVENIPVPPLEVIPISEIHVNNLPSIQFYDYCEKVCNIDKELTDYIDIMNGVCPTCGRALIEH